MATGGTRRPGSGWDVMPEEWEEGEVLLEFTRIGNSVKVAAVDPVTKVEVSIVGPSTASRLQLERAAVRKLRYVLAEQGR